MERVILFSAKQAAKRTAKRTIGTGQRLGTSLQEARTPIIDGDSDGKCREKNGTWIPCPPGIGRGSILDENGSIIGQDLQPQVGIDPYKSLSKSYKDKMNEKLSQMGLSRTHMKRQLRKLYSQASPELVAVARTWYRRVNEGTQDLVNSINNRYGSKISFEQGVGVVAALSPAREFGKNAGDAKKILVGIAEDADFSLSDEAIEEYVNYSAPKKTAEEILQEQARRKQQVGRIKALAQANNGNVKPSQFEDSELHLLAVVHPTFSGLKNTTGFREVVRALAIARGGDPEELLGGPKVRSFYSNIMNPEGDRVTIDTWMYRGMIDPKKKITSISKGKKGAPDKVFSGTWAEFEDGTATGKEKKLQDLFQGSPSDAKSGVPPNTGLYPEFAEAVREVAKELNLAPAALQAIVWEIARTRAGYESSNWDKIMEGFRL